MEKIIGNAKESLEKTSDLFAEIFGEFQAKDLFSAASQMINLEIEKAENRERFKNLQDDAVRKKIDEEKAEKIKALQEEAAAALDKRAEISEAAPVQDELPKEDKPKGKKKK